MQQRRARILVVDPRDGALSRCLEAPLRRHIIEYARDAWEAIYRIDCAARPYDIIFCDLARGDVPGPELWAFLSITRKSAARRMVFVASAPIGAQARAFLDRAGNACIALPSDGNGLAALEIRRDADRWAVGT